MPSAGPPELARSVALGQDPDDPMQCALDAKFSGHGAAMEPPLGDTEGASPGILDRVAQLQGVTWEWRDPLVHGDGRLRQMGVLAQDVQRAFPEAVVRDPQGGHLLVDYAGLVGALVEAVKELSRRVVALERQIAEQRPESDTSIEEH